MKIVGDYKWRKFKYRDEVPVNILNEDFDYLDRDMIDGFIKYKNNWYHINDFFVIKGGEFDGYHNETAFSGVAINLSEDLEEYQIFSIYS